MSQTEIATAASSGFANEIVAPGDVVLDVSSAGKGLKLSGGLRQDGERVVATKSGRLRDVKSGKFWVEGSQRTYVPVVEDLVIGVVADSRYEVYSVDIGAPTLASLPKLATERATRKNALDFQVGALCYARVVKAHRDIYPELSCMDASGKSAGFGALKGGYLFHCSTNLARALLSKHKCPVLEALGKSLTYEMAVGMNGRVWVKADSPSTIIAVSNAISSSEMQSPAQQYQLVQKILESMDLAKGGK